MKNKFWKFATTIVVSLIILNPETLGLALFIDAIGLDIFLALVTTQLAAFFGVIFHTNIVKIIAYIKSVIRHRFSALTWKAPARKLAFTVTSPAMLMHVLVLSAVIDTLASTIN